MCVHIARDTIIEGNDASIKRIEKSLKTLGLLKIVQKYLSSTYWA